MATSILDRPNDVKDGESPFYTEDSTHAPYVSRRTAISLPQGSGSGTDSDTVDQFDAVSAKVGGPNKLVATGSNGFIPISTIPPTTTSGGGTGGGTIANSALILATDLANYGVITIDTDGAVRFTRTTTPTVSVTLLYNGTSTYWVTFDSTDSVLRTQVSTFSTTVRSLTLLDSSLNAWSVTIDPDGVVRTTSLGSI